MGPAMNFVIQAYSNIKLAIAVYLIKTPGASKEMDRAKGMALVQEKIKPYHTSIIDTTRTNIIDSCIHNCHVVRYDRLITSI